MKVIYQWEGFDQWWEYSDWYTDSLHENPNTVFERILERETKGLNIIKEITGSETKCTFALVDSLGETIRIEVLCATS